MGNIQGKAPSLGEATLIDGTKIEYVITDNPPRGGVKYTYFTPDKQHVVQFFNNPAEAKDPNLHARIKAILGKFNPTLPENEGGAVGNDKVTADYFAKTFCWPVGIVKYPEFGIVCPAYPNEFFFNKHSSTMLALDGKDKKSNWFTTPKNRKYLYPTELGDFKNMLKMSILLARAIRRMHQAGLAHSDLSNNNVLINPIEGNCVIIDIDSLVVPGLFPPNVIGTRGYVAPEVLASLGLSYDDPNRKHPSTYSDIHALPVLIYEYLFFRHPLMGPKIYSSVSAEEDDFLALGSKATFIEHPYDTSNRPKDLRFTIKDLGPILQKLFLRAFVEGLHSPNERPTALEWERGLVQTWDLLHPCTNPNCEKKYFVFYDVNKPICPYCHQKIRETEVVRFKFKTELRGRSGQWREIGEMNITHNAPLFKWHVFSNVFPNEKADRTMQAYVCKYRGKWLLVNQNINGLMSPMGNLVPAGQAIHLQDGVVFRASRDPGGFLVEVVIKKI